MPMGGAGAYQDFEEDLDDEEKERVSQVIIANEERKRALFEKQQEEEDLKKQRKVKGRGELEKWNEQRKKEIEGRRRENVEQEKLYHENLQAQRNGPNPWERVVANCDMNSTSYVGGADVTRMRQAMINRKADLTKSS